MDDEDEAEMAMMFAALRDYALDPANYHVAREGHNVTVSAARQFSDGLEYGTARMAPRSFIAPSGPPS